MLDIPVPESEQENAQDDFSTPNSFSEDFSREPLSEIYEENALERFPPIPSPKRSVDLSSSIPSSIVDSESVKTSRCSSVISRDVEVMRNTAQIQRMHLKSINAMEFIDNGYPATTRSPAKRTFLEIPVLKRRDERTNGRINPEAESKCVFCEKSYDSDDDEELISCFGTMSGANKRVHCASKFHRKCAIFYNSNGFLFQYAARVECQNKLLCPLHCCAACNVDHKKQSAYIGDMTECALCLRSFHTETCVPAGSKPLEVELEVGGKIVTVDMMICPAHHVPSKVLANINACRDCRKRGKLVKCVTCIRSFHVKCHDAVTVDGQSNPMDRCESCLCQDVIRYNVPIIAKWERGWYLAITRDWYYYPDKHSVRYNTVGNTVVEWPDTRSADGKPQMSIIPVNEIAELSRFYIRHPIVKNLADKNYWMKVFEEFDPFKDIPVVYKEVHRVIPTSKSTKKVTSDCPETDLCKCVGENRCTTQECCYVAFECECPPECSQDGRVCGNRRISERYQNPNIEYHVAAKKGYGLFATAKIRKGEFIAEYIGEVIDAAERERRSRVISISRDFQANHYMLRTDDGMTIDATTMGNVARYINHSCDPNSMAVSRRIFVKYGSNDCSLYEPRSFIKAIRDIEPEEEITFNYNMEGASLPRCKCESANCTGEIAMNSLRNVKEEESEEDESDEEAETVPKVVEPEGSELEQRPKIVAKRRQTHLGVSSNNEESSAAVRKSARQSMLIKREENTIEEENDNNTAESGGHGKWKYIQVFTERKTKEEEDEESLRRLEVIKRFNSETAMSAWHREYCRSFGLEPSPMFAVKNDAISNEQSSSPKVSQASDSSVSEEKQVKEENDENLPLSDTSAQSETPRRS